MSLYQSLFFMSLVGGMAGLAAWALTTLLAGLVQFPAISPDLIPAVLLGSFMGGLTVGLATTGRATVCCCVVCSRESASEASPDYSVPPCRSRYGTRSSFTT